MACELHSICAEAAAPDLQSSNYAWPPISPYNQFAGFNRPHIMKLARIPLPLRVALMYVLLGVAGILLSDRLAASAVRDAAELTIVQTYKGWFFVVLSGLVLLVVLGLEHNRRRTTERDLLDLFENAVEGIFRASLQGVLLGANPAMARLFGYASSLDMTSEVSNLWTALYADASGGEALVARLVRDGYVEKYESQQIRKDGQVIWTSMNARLIRNGSGSPTAVEGLLADITERKYAEQALRDSEARHRHLVEHSPYAIAVHQQGRLVYVNQAGALLMGAVSAAELCGRSVLEFVHPDSRDAVKAELEPLPGGRAASTLEVKLLRLDGSVVWAEVNAHLLTFMKEPAVQLMIRDLSAQRAAEEALRTNEERLRAIVDHTRSIYYSHTPQHDLTYISSQAESTLGYRPDELRAAWRELLTDHPINARARELHQKAIETGIAQEPFTLQIKTKDGSPIWMEVQETPVVREGKILAIVGSLTDITDRKLTEEDLERRVADLTVLHAVAMAGSQSQSQDELITRTTQIISGMLYPENAGVYLLNDADDLLLPHPSYWGTDLPDSRRPLYLSEGIVGQVASSGRAVRLNDVTSDPTYVRGTNGIQSELCVPLVVNQKVIGVLNVESRTPSAFGANDERVLTTIADTLGTAIERLRLFATEQERRLQAEHLRAATASLTRTVELNQLYGIMLRSLGSLVPFQYASIELVEGEFLQMVASQGNPMQRPANGWPVPGAGNLSRSQTSIVMDPPERPGASTALALGVEAKATSWITVPMLMQDQLIGYIHLGNGNTGAFSEEHASMVQTFANQAAIAIHNARLFQEERRRAKIIEALADIANEIARTPDLSDLLDHVAQRTLDLLKASHVAIYLVQNDNETVAPVAARGTYSQELLSHSIRVGEGITGNIVASGKSEIVNDTPGDPRTIRVPGTPIEDGAQETMMSAPLILRDRAIGAINAWRLRSDGLFNESELNFLVSIAHQTSISIALSRLFQETVRRAEEAAAIAEVGRDISATLQLDLVLERIAAYAKDLLNAETSAIYLLESKDGRLHAVAAKGVDAAEIKNDPVEIGSGLSGNIASSKHGEIVNYAPADPRAVTVKGTVNDPFEHFMGVPVLNRDELTGTLVVWRTGAGQEFQPPELNFLSGLAQQAAVAIENARLFQLEKDRRQEAENLQVAATAVASSLDLEQVLHTIMVALSQVIPFDSAAIRLLEGDHVRIRATQGSPQPEPAAEQVLPASNTLLRAIHLSGKAVILADAQEDSRFEEWVGGDHVRGWLGVPLISRGTIIGYITLESGHVHAFHEKDASLAQSFAHQAAVAIENARLYSSLELANQELSKAYDTTLEGWGNALELRDKETQGHTRRVADLTIKLGRQLGVHEPELTTLRRGVLVHDIGKMGVPDHILHKKTSLTREEWEEMYKHPQYAFDLLYPIPYLRSAINVAYCHHERWNGSGYPRGLSGEDIPLPARIFAVVDVWDALLSNRPYRKAWPRGKVVQYLRHQSGVLFDPSVVKAFLNMVELNDNSASGPGSTGRRVT
jgi:PAS domain S-box-containing protein